MDLAQIISGFAVGAVVGVTGVGGGALMTPLLVLLFGIAPATAVGTDLLYAATTKLGGTYVHGRRGNIDWRIAGLLASGSLPAAVLTLVAGLGHWWLGSIDWRLFATLLIGSLPGIFLGSHFAHRIPGGVLRPLLAGMLILVGGKLILA